MGTKILAQFVYVVRFSATGGGLGACKPQFLVLIKMTALCSTFLPLFAFPFLCASLHGHYTFGTFALKQSFGSVSRGCRQEEGTVASQAEHKGSMSHPGPLSDGVSGNIVHVTHTQGRAARPPQLLLWLFMLLRALELLIYYTVGL